MSKRSKKVRKSRVAQEGWKVVHVSMARYNQERADIQICVLALGHVEGSRSFFLPQGDMATDFFERELDEAWDRLTPNQQMAVLNGNFRLTVPTMREVIGELGGEPVFARHQAQEEPRTLLERIRDEAKQEVAEKHALLEREPWLKGLG